MKIRVLTVKTSERRVTHKSNVLMRYIQKMVILDSFADVMHIKFD